MKVVYDVYTEWGIYMFVVSGKNSLVRLLVGVLVLTSVILSQLHHSNWMYFTGFIGFMLIFSSITGICPMEMMLKKAGVQEKKICDMKTNS